MEVATAGTRHASGGPAKEMQHPSLPMAFEAQADRIPDDDAVIDPSRDKKLTFAETRDMAYRVAGGLKSLGIGKGDTVAIMLNNRWEFIPIDLGAAYLGGVPFSRLDPTVGMDDVLLVAATETVTGDDIAAFKTALAEVMA